VIPSIAFVTEYWSIKRSLVSLKLSFVWLNLSHLRQSTQSTAPDTSSTLACGLFIAQCASDSGPI